MDLCGHTVRVQDPDDERQLWRWECQRLRGHDGEHASTNRVRVFVWHDNDEIIPANTQISGGTPSAEAGCSAFRIAYPRDDKQYEYVEQRHMIEYPSAKAGWEQIVRHDGMAGQPCFYVWRRLRRPNTQISGGTPSADLGVRRLEVTDGSAIQSR